MTKTYIKIYGPPLLKAIKSLEGVAVKMSKEKQVKFSHKCIPYPTRLQSDNQDWNNYLNNLKNTYVECYEPAKIISEAHQTLGDRDFMFEWAEKPTLTQLNQLTEEIDAALGGLGVLYTMTTE